MKVSGFLLLFLLCFNNKGTINRLQDEQNIQDQKIVLNKSSGTNLEVNYNCSINDSYFKISYDDSFVTHTEGVKILEFCENTREKCINQGFRENYNNSNNQLLEIKINPNRRSDGVVGVTNISRNLFSNKASNSIEIFGQTRLNYSMKSTIVHEYFHTIQSNYNCGSKNSSWFTEACATWAEFKFYDDALDPYSYIKYEYLNKYKDESIFNQAGYGCSIFPITLTMLYGDNIIKEIYESLNDYIYTYNFNDLKDVINSAVKKYDENASFDSVYNKMAAMLISYGSWDNSFLNNNLDNNDFENYYLPSIVEVNSPISNSIKSYATNYYEIGLDSGVSSHDINALINVGSSNTIAQLYTIDNYGKHNIIGLNLDESNIYQYTIKNFGSSVTKAYIVLTSNDSSTYDYSVSLSYSNHDFIGHNCKYCNTYSSNHNYNYSYSAIDKLYHYSNCSCGEQSKQPHVVSSSSTGFIKYCLLCGGQASVGITKFDTISLVDCSYILDNGVIVLTDQDIIKLKSYNYDINRLLKEIM